MTVSQTLVGTFAAGRNSRSATWAEDEERTGQTIAVSLGD